MFYGIFKRFLNKFLTKVGKKLYKFRPKEFSEGWLSSAGLIRCATGEGENIYYIPTIAT